MQSSGQERSEHLRRVIRESYAQVARSGSSCCSRTDGCCGSASDSIGYSPEELNFLPEGADLGLGCGNPIAIASLKAGETVLDLGCGAGIDCFLAARQVGRSGFVIGVDMTPEMIERARANARKGIYTNVEFRLGEIEHLPVADSSVDVVISNCVINLSPDKPQVFREAFRVLRPHGRLVVSDIVLSEPLPKALLESTAAYVSCIAGASLRQEYLAMITVAGFSNVNIACEIGFPLDVPVTDSSVQTTPARLGISADSIRSITVLAFKTEAIL